MKKIPFFLTIFFLEVLFFSCLFSRASADPGTPLGAGEGDRWAFCIGISNYEDPRIVDSPGSGGDARGIAEVLREKGGFRKVFLLSDELDRRDPLFPSRKNILALFRRYREIIKPRDLVLFFFSGQGIMSPSGGSFLALQDTRLARLRTTALPMQEVLDFFKKTGVKRSLLMLDASREEITVQGYRDFRGLYPDRYFKRGVTALFYGARKGFFSHTDPDTGHGVFATFLMRGLKGEADMTSAGNGDGIVSLAELSAFVKEGMGMWSVENPEKQAPYIKILAGGMMEMPLVQTAARGGEGEAVPAVASAVQVETAEKMPVGSERKEEAVTPPGQKEARAKETVTPKVEVDREESLALSAKGGQEEIMISAPAPSVKEMMAEKETKGPGDKIPALTTREPAEEEPEKKVAPPPTIAAIPEGPEISFPEESVKEREEITPAPPEPGKEGTEEEALSPEVAPAPQEVETPGPKVTEEPEKETPKQTPPPTVEEAPPPEKEALEVASLPPPKPLKPIVLRDRPKSLSPMNVREMLEKLHFYSTCWNYNGDFCNPEGDFDNAFVDNGDGTVTDKATGLMWQKSGSPDPMTWEEARAYAEAANREAFAGYTDWRLPTLEELLSLMERSWRNSDLFIDPIFDKAQRYIWSADTRDLNTAWKANYHMGFVIFFPKSSMNSVRLVRSLR
ncbi:MAG: DUF1566 domain-containing protein [Deltaproteobacteria bacterium]|nr:DUF1566 domain-containing protein [Deltaproteobacteria bacterium]